jgi:ABC-2 type transport system ATP-binding protein
MRVLLRDLAKLDKAVLVSSHILPELADVCDTVGIVSKGNLIASGPVQEILRNIRQTRMMEINVLKFTEQARQVLASAPGEWNPIEDEKEDGKLRYEVTADDAQLAQALLELLKKGIPVTNFAEVPADLEDVFMSLTK